MPGMSEARTAHPHDARVDVWLVSGDETAPFSAPLDDRYGLLDDDDRAALRRLRVAGDRRSYLVCHLLLRLALSHASQGRVPPERWRFARSAHGRPSVAGPQLSGLDFSLSRSSGLSVVAVAEAEGCRVGVDAERSDRPLCCIPEDVGLSPTERAHLASCPSARRPAEFLKVWTLKEAYGKLCGCGICPAPERVEVPEGVHTETHQISTAGGVYRTSLAVQSPAGVRPRVRFHRLDTLWPDAGRAPRLPADEGAVAAVTDNEAR